jgi:hypothetical protein
MKLTWPGKRFSVAAAAATAPGNSEEHRMKPNPYQLIESALEPGETLLWTGHQHRPSMRSAKFLVKFVFLLAIFGASATVLITSIQSNEFKGGLLILLFPMFLIGLGLMKMVNDSLTGGRTCYGVTQRHALIATVGYQPEVRSVWLGNIDSIEARLNDRGHGSIKCYAPLEPPFGKVNNKGEIRLKPLFRGVADVRTVRDLLEQEINTQRATRDCREDDIYRFVRPDINKTI